jgi:WD40 repeat protein
MKRYLWILLIGANCVWLNAQTAIQTLENTHTGKLQSFDINDDGSLLITGGIDNRAHMWNVATSEKLKSFMDVQAFAAVEFSPDNSKVVTSNNSNKVILWDAVTLKPLAILKGNTTAVLSLAFNPTNQYIIGGCADGKIFVWDENGKPLKNFAASSKEINKVAYTSDGSKLIIYSSGLVSVWDGTSLNKIKDLNSDKATVNDVDVAHQTSTIVRILDNKTLKITSLDQPYQESEISIANEKITSVNYSPDDKYLAVGNEKGDIIVLSCMLKDTVFKVKNALNNVSKLAFTKDGNRLFSSSSNGTIKIWDVSKLGITPGTNVLTAQNTNTTSAADNQYRGGDPLKGLNVSYTGNELQFGKFYALIIGIDSYKGLWPALKNAVNDAKALETTLRNKYKFDYFKQLYNEQATRVNIIKEMEWLVDNVKPTDNLLIFYSGHGEYNESLKKGYWVPVDALNKSTSSYISNSDIQTFLGGIKSKHTLLISDACFSGDIFRGDSKTMPFEESDKYYAKVNNIISRKAMTSGGIEPVLDGGQNGHSIFSYYLLKILDNNDKKYLVSSQLYEGIKIPVINNSEQSPLFSAIKNAGDEGGEFIFLKK